MWRSSFSDGCVQISICLRLPATHDDLFFDVFSADFFSTWVSKRLEALSLPPFRELVRFVEPQLKGLGTASTVAIEIDPWIRRVRMQWKLDLNLNLYLNSPRL